MKKWIEHNLTVNLFTLLYFVGWSILQRPDRRGTNHLLTNCSIWRFCSRIFRQMFFFHWKLDFTTDSWRSQSQWPQEQVNIIYFHEFFVLITIWNFHEFFSFFQPRGKNEGRWNGVNFQCYVEPFQWSLLWCGYEKGMYSNNLI